MPSIGPLEIIAVLVIVFLLFGATRLPKLGKSMGQSIRGFKTGLHEDVPDDDDEKPAKGEAAKLDKGDETDKS
jgi:sec-independent protein translocase protein TatA